MKYFFLWLINIAMIICAVMLPEECNGSIKIANMIVAGCVK